MEPSVFATLRVAFASKSYFWTRISSNGSTANALGAGNRNTATRAKSAVAAPVCRGVLAEAARGPSAVASALRPSSQLFIPQRHHRVDLHGAAGGNVAVERRGHDE